MSATDESAGDGAAEFDPETGAVLRTEGLTKRFGDFTAVDSVDLAVADGEFRSVIGPNGAGKTTLFNCITGALAPTEGGVYFRGEEVTRMAPHERVRRGMGRSFQISTVFGGLSVRENVRLSAQSVAEGAGEISLPRKLFSPTDRFESVERRTDEVLAEIGLENRADEYARTLAHGDRRRLELGLVLATDPDLVLLDEPTAGMGSEETRRTIALVEEVLADRTMLLIEHDIDLVMNVSDTVTVLNRGQVLATDTPERIADDESVQRAYLGGVRE
ncbi:ABC transporter ATP-binding protein (plasmid) [Halorussus limi]|uniref:Probable branched-chain amino acid transport ATP-binding protein LivG n=1 Tax=Halorussus limi TaxID=2938695 RepID=A0A8U0I0P3_9EURY|nr:ABC transporter ATP-binding protein [Halorussus limi]UPV76364.1 ABC transporter ATP-binding protein [Halorussus limi]